MQASITLQHNTLHFFCLYRPPPNRRNNLTDSLFTEQLPDLLDYAINLPGFICFVGDMNIHFDNPLQSLTKQTLTTLSLHYLVQVIDKPTLRCDHIIDWVIVRPDDDIHEKSTVTDSHESDHYCTKSYFNVSVSKPSTHTVLLGTLLTLIAHPLLLNFPVFQSFHLLKRQASSVTICALY